MSATTALKLSDLLQEVRHIELQSRRLVRGVLAGGYHSVFRGAGIEFDEVREYVEGDDPRSVDWNVSARMGRPFVKKYIDERELAVLFVLDLSPSMDCGGGVWSLRQAAARLAALLALTAIQNHDRVGLIAFADGVEKFVPPRKGATHGLRIIRDCLALRATGAGTRIGPALDFAAKAVRRRSIVFLLSDFQGDTALPELRACARRHDLIAVRLFPAEHTQVPQALVRLRDPESQRELLLDGRRSKEREQYHARLAEWRQQGARELLRAGADCIDVVLPLAADRQALVRPILEFFHRRELTRLHS